MMCRFRDLLTVRGYRKHYQTSGKFRYRQMRICLNITFPLISVKNRQKAFSFRSFAPLASHEEESPESWIHLGTLPPNCYHRSALLACHGPPWQILKTPLHETILFDQEIILETCPDNADT